MRSEDRLKGVHRVNDKGDFEQFVANRSGVLLRTAYLLCAGDRGAAEDMLVLPWRHRSPAGRSARSRRPGTAAVPADPRRSRGRQGVSAGGGQALGGGPAE